VSLESSINFENAQLSAVQLSQISTAPLFRQIFAGNKLIIYVRRWLPTACCLLVLNQPLGPRETKVDAKSQQGKSTATDHSSINPVTHEPTSMGHRKRHCGIPGQVGKYVPQKKCYYPQ
jgi:hypothetical protein